jgi:SAM-dependent methyltransferase
LSRLPKRRSVIAGAQRLGDTVFDRVFGIETAGPAGPSELGFGPDTGSPYQPSNWANLIGLVRMMRTLNIGSGDVFLDLGCGKGQVLFLAAHFPFGRVIGLDASEDMISIARRNLDPLRHRFKSRHVELVVGDAADYEIPVDVSICYLYNPFPRPIMERVMAQLDASLAARPRRIRILYLEARDADLIVADGFREIRTIRRLKQFVRNQGDERGR